MGVEQKPDYFSLGSLIEQTSFTDEVKQRFFHTWCEVNDSLIPDFITDRNWEERGISSLIEKRSDGKNTLFIPADIHLWEMTAIVGWIDHDTFSSEHRLSQKATKELEETGLMFSQTGVYLAKRVEKIEHGQAIARELAQRFYCYGKKLQNEGVDDNIPIEQITDEELTDEETQRVDHWIAGEKVYASRLTKVQKEIDKNPEQENKLIEKHRMATLNQFFQIAERTFGKEDQSQTLQGSTSTSFAFIKRVEDHIAEAVEVPKRELNSAIFRHGVEKLVYELRSRRFGDRWESVLKWYANDILRLVHQPEFQPQTLIHELNLTALRQNLTQARKSGNTEKIAKREYAAALKIQQAVSAFSYLARADTPQKIIQEQKLNCLGATILGGALMRELEISYLPVSLPGHAIIFLITSDEKVYWFDLIGQKYNAQLINDEQDKPRNKDEKTIADIVEFSKYPTAVGLKVDMSSPGMRGHFPWLDPGDDRYAFLLPPQFGEEYFMFGNIAYLLTLLDRYEEAEQMYKEAIAKNPRLPFFYSSLCDVLQKLGKDEEAILAIRNGLAIDPNDVDLYNQLGAVYFKKDDFHQAEICFRKAIDLNPRLSGSYRNLLETLLKKRHTKEALKVLARANSVDFFDMGNVIYKEALFGNPLALERSVLYYNKAVNADESFRYSYFGLGRSFQGLGYREKVAESYTKFLDLADPEKDKEWIKLTKIALESLTTKKE